MTEDSKKIKNAIKSFTHAHGPHFIPVPLCYQETPYTCGVACVQSILASYGITYRQDLLIEMLKQKPFFGTDYHEIIRFLQMLKFQAVLQADLEIEALKNYINKGITPMLLLQAWKEDDIAYPYVWRDSHYVIACGYQENQIIFMDPFTLGNYTYVTYSDLPKRWHSLDQAGNHLTFSAIIIQHKKLTNIYKPEEIKYME